MGPFLKFVPFYNQYAPMGHWHPVNRYRNKKMGLKTHFFNRKTQLKTVKISSLSKNCC